MYSHISDILSDFFIVCGFIVYLSLFIFSFIFRLLQMGLSSCFFLAILARFSNKYFIIVELNFFYLLHFL